jgi:hypothetical protein
MKLKSVLIGLLSLALAVVLVAGCANKMEPAKKAIADIEAALHAAGPDASKYIPDQVKAVKGQIADLKTKFDQKDYKSVIAAAPAILAQAQALVPAAAAKKAEVVAALPTAWAELSGSVPAAIESRVEQLSMAGNAQGGVDAATLEDARKSAQKCRNQWIKASEMQAAGRLEYAVGFGKYIKENADRALATLGAPAG